MSIDYFDASADGYARRARGRPEFQERFALFTRLAQATLPTGGRALDLGCGPGDLLALLADNGFGVTGVDGSEAMLARAREVVPTGDFMSSRLPLSSAHIARLRRRFDLVTASSLLEYIDDDYLMMAQIHDCLRPGGVALVSFP